MNTLTQQSNQQQNDAALLAEAVTHWARPRDVAPQLDLTVAFVYKLIHNGTLRAVQTRFGWLVDPQSVAEYDASGVKGKRRISRCA